MSLCACAQVDFLWSGAEGGRTKGTLVMFFNSPASAALLCCAVAQLFHCLLDAGRQGEVVTQHQDPPSASQRLLANALCCGPASSSQFWRQALDKVQSLLNSNQTQEMHWLGSSCVQRLLPAVCCLSGCNSSVQTSELNQDGL